jgi:predicted nucleotidyltransferase
MPSRSARRRPAASCAEGGGAAVCLFGCRARGEAEPESDFDRAVVLLKARAGS